MHEAFEHDSVCVYKKGGVLVLVAPVLNNSSVLVLICRHGRLQPQQ